MGHGSADPHAPRARERAREWAPGAPQDRPLFAVLLAGASLYNRAAQDMQPCAAHFKRLLLLSAEKDHIEGEDHQIVISEDRVCHRGRDAFEWKAPERRPPKRFDRRLEEEVQAVGGGYCRLRMPLKLAFAVTETVAGHRLVALEGGRGPPF